MPKEEEQVFKTQEAQLENIVNELKNINKISDAKDNALIVSSDDEGKPLTFLKKLKMSGAIEQVEVKDGKLDIKLNENFCGTIDFCGDLTSYKRCAKNRTEAYSGNRTGPFAIERPFGNEIIIDVFEELLKKIKEHNKTKQKDKQIQFVAVPGNHEFLGFQGNEDNLAVVGKYKKFETDPVDGRQALKTKLRGVKVIADIQKYYLEQVKENGEEKDIVDDDYGDSIGNIAEKIKKLDEESKNIGELIKNIDEEKMEKINEDIEILKEDIKRNGYLKNTNDLTLSKLNVLKWNKSNLLSKIVFCHNGKKFRTLHSFALFAQQEAWEEEDLVGVDGKKITADNQKKHFGTNLNQNIVNIDGVSRKSFPDKKVFKYNKIATFVGHEGYRIVDKQTGKVFCVDTTSKQYMLFIVDEENKIQGYDLKTGKIVTLECMKMETYDVREKKYVKIQSNIRRHLAKKKAIKYKIQSNIRRHLEKKYCDFLIKEFFSPYNNVDAAFKDEEFRKKFCKHFSEEQNWFGFLPQDDNKQKLVVDKEPKKIKNNNKLINKKKKKTSLKKQL